MVCVPQHTVSAVMQMNEAVKDLTVHFLRELHRVSVPVNEPNLRNTITSSSLLSSGASQQEHRDEGF